MSHLLAISVGPVQEFIAAARRTRDLWFGSFLLSELSKAAARAISQRAGRDSLILPAPERDEDLLPEASLSGANVVVAERPASYEPASSGEEAKKHVKETWERFARKVLDDQELSRIVQREIWK